MDIEHPRHSIGWPLILIAAGIIFLLSNIGILAGDVWETLVKFWPLILVIMGLDGLYRGEGLVGALFIAGIGGVFLLSNLGYLTFDVWGTIIRFWPFLIIAVGLDIILGRQGRRSIWSFIIGFILFLGLLGSLLWFAGQNSPLSHTGLQEPISYEVGTLQSVKVDVEAIAGDLSIHPAADSKSLVYGSVQLARGETLVNDLNGSGSQGTVTIKSSAINISPTFRTGQQATWDLGVTKSVPVDLVVSLPLGRTKVDLTGMKPERVKITNVLGRTEVILPAEGDFAGRVETVMGTMVLKIPKDTAVRLHLSTVITSSQIPDGFERVGDTLTSPNANTAQKVIDLEVSLVMGRLEIKFLE